MQKQSCKIFKNKANSCFSTLMAEKKATKKTVKKTPVKKTKTKTEKSKTSKASKSKAKTKKIEEPVGDMGIVIVDDDIEIDQDKINEERRAYLEEARSQEAFD